MIDIAAVPGLRPTPERIRETLFNWLQPRLPGARCLDLFAGTGALGLEALSRGASAAVFVESSRRAAGMLRRSIDSLPADDATVTQADAFRYLDAAAGGPFDIVFLDPPFAADCTGELCRLLAAGTALAAGAVVYTEQDRARPPAALPPGWQILKQSAAGNVRYSLLSTDPAPRSDG